MAGEPSIGYYLFVYREQLNRRKVRALRLSKVKHHLTNGIVALTWNNITEYGKDELGNLMDTIMYNEKLKHDIEEAIINKYYPRRQVTDL